MQKYDKNEQSANSSDRMFSRWNKFMTEFAREKPVIGDYTSKGIWLVPTGKKIRLKYSGLLVDNGAQDVYTAISYGSNNYWDDVKYYHMSKIDDKTFEVLIPASEKTNLNVCFKDGANNWDNNSGRNYVFDAL